MHNALHLFSFNLICNVTYFEFFLPSDPISDLCLVPITVEVDFIMNPVFHNDSLATDVKSLLVK